MTPARKTRQKKPSRKKIETIMYSPGKESAKKSKQRANKKKTPEFEKFQKNIRSKFGYNLRKKISRPKSDI